MKSNLYYCILLFFHYIKADEDINTLEVDGTNQLKKSELSFLGKSFGKILGKVVSSGIMKAVKKSGKVAAKKLIVGAIKTGTAVAQRKMQEKANKLLKRNEEIPEE